MAVIKTSDVTPRALNCRCAAPGTLIRCLAGDAPGLCGRLCERLRTNDWAAAQAQEAANG